MTSGVVGAPAEDATTRPAVSSTWITVVRPLVANTVGSISGKGSLSRCRAIWAARAEAASSAEDCNEDCNNHNNAPAASVSVAAKTRTAAAAARTRTPLRAHRFGDRRTPIVVILSPRVSATVSR